MKRIIAWIIIFSLMGSGIHGQKTCPKDKILADFDVLVQELRLQHQGLYQYTQQQEVDQTLDSVRQSLGAMDRLEFYQVVRYIIGLTNEGHTQVNLPRMTMVKVGLARRFLPLGVISCDRALIVSQNFGEQVKGLQKGSKLLSVNDRKIGDILDDILPLIPTDGFNQTSRYEWVGGINFSLLYTLFYGRCRYYDIAFENYADHKVHHVRIPAIRFTGFKSKRAQFPSKSFDFDKFHFEAINDSIAYLSIPSFSSGETEFEAFYASQFRQIKALGINHLILDIQANGGGTEGNENLLFSYLLDTALQKYRAVSMLPQPFLKDQNNPDYVADQWRLEDTMAYRGDFTLSSNYFSDLGYTVPDPDLVYKGKLYTLISGQTFSGGAEFASLLRMSGRSIFIGEETGGTYEGNVSGYSETVKLPYTNITVDIPTVHFQMNVTPEVRARGIMPDYTVPQSWDDYMNNDNAKLRFAVQLITNGGSDLE
ncbi:MAG: S41 family peptidase [Bacteroidota bacterium]